MTSYLFFYSLWHWSSQWKDTLELVQAVHFLSIISQGVSKKAVTWQDFYFNIFTPDKIILEEWQWSNIYRQCSLAQSIVKLNTQNYVGIMLMLWYEDKRQSTWNEGWLLINPRLQWGSALPERRSRFHFVICDLPAAFQRLVCYFNVLNYVRTVSFKHAFVCVCVCTLYISQGVTKSGHWWGPWGPCMDRPQEYRQ